jgi:hypothetical protein
MTPQTTWITVAKPIKLPAKCRNKEVKNLPKAESQKILGAYIVKNPGKRLDQIALELGWGAGKTEWIFKSLGVKFRYGAFCTDTVEPRVTT